MKSLLTLRRALALALLSFLAAAPASATTYATWIMVWDGHDQSWWKPDSTIGAKVPEGSGWGSIDWADNSRIGGYLDDIKAAGVRVVIADLTNGWGWLNTRCQYIQELCAQKGMQFCVAENSSGDLHRFETHAKDIWTNFAGPSSPHPATYLQYEGKPLIVCYGIRTWVDAYQKSTGPWRSRFHLVWASGEDSAPDKWGWQLEPWVGVFPSSDSMFVTSSIKWKNDDALWRKSLAWLDYNFKLARSFNARYVIVGSYDDLFERNSWLIADTSGCIPGRQMRDPTGALSTTAYFDRVQQWIRGKPSVVPSGLLRDGCYRIVNRNSHRQLVLQNNDGVPGSKLEQRDPERSLATYFWIYHLGQNSYRIIALDAGLSIEPPGGSIDVGLPVQTQWDSNVDWQTWTIARADRGWYTIRNNHTGDMLDIAGASPAAGALAVQNIGDGAPSQEWQFEPVLLL